MKQEFLKSKALVIAMAAMTAGVVGCGGDDSEGGDNTDKCAGITCEGEQVCNPETGTCEEPGEEEDKCADVTCEGEGQVCNPSTGECEDGGSNEQPLECGEDEEDCGGSCKNIKNDNNNCGGCDITCDTDAGETCTDGVCAIPAVCQDSDAAICDTTVNGVKKCVDGQFVVEECGDKVCTDAEGGASCQEAAAECDANTPASCEGNAAKTCGNDGKFVITDCGTKACVDGACSEEAFVAECEDSVAPACDADTNSVKSCVNQKWNYVACGTLTCAVDETTGEPGCKAVAECDETYVPTCDGENALKICDVENGVFKSEACPENQFCFAGADASTAASCKASSVDDLCPDDPEKAVPGVCGCGVPDTDLNNNKVIDCQEEGVDLCPDDPKKTLPGICGCGIADDGDNPTCITSEKNYCPNDETKRLPGVCGCGIPDTFNSFTRLPWCIGTDSTYGTPFDSCLEDDKKNIVGICGCGVEDKDLVCLEAVEDACPDDPDKTAPGFCGCGVADTKDESGKYACDTDGDGVVNALDQCPENAHKYIDDGCACNQALVNVDGKNRCANIINNVSEFMEFRNNVYKNVKNGTNDIYILANDIDLGDELSVSEFTWASGTFRGKLLGNNKKISYTYEGNAATLNCTDATRCGLFYNLTGAYIENLELNFNVSNNKSYVGMLAGYADGGTTINNVKITGNVSATSERVGGLVGGTNNVNISNITANGDVTGKGNHVGGIVGSATNTRISGITREGNVVNEHVNGHYTGGIVGSIDHASSMLADIDMKGDVSGNWHYVGGVVGHMNNGGPINKVNFDGNVTNTGGYNIGGIAGYACAVSSDIVVKGTITGQRVGGGAFGSYGCGGMTNIENYATINMKNTINNGSMSTGGIAGSVGGGYTYKNLVNHTDITADCDPLTSDRCAYVGGIFGYLGKNTTNKLMANLEDLENKGNLNVKSYYNGGIIGHANAANAKNLKNSGNIVGATSSNGGIFGGLTNDTADVTTLENLENTGNISGKGEYNAGIMGAGFATNMKNIKNTGNITGATNYSGGIVGNYSNYPTKRASLENIDNKGNLECTGSYNGGIIGRAYSVSAKNVKNSGNVTGGWSYNGGFIGYLEIPTNGVKTADYVFENIDTTGKVAARQDHVGGLFGRIYYGVNAKKLIITNASNSGDVTGRNYIGGGMGSMLHNATAEITDIYASGNVSAYTEEGVNSTTGVGGLFGSIDANDTHIYIGANKATHTTNINRAYATGNVTSANADNVGGLIGYMNAAGAVTHTQNGKRIECPTDSTKYFTENQKVFYPVTHTTKLTNVYAQGKVTGKTDVGGLIGELYSLSKTEKETVKYNTYDASCNKVAADPKELSAKKSSTFILANAYSAGDAISSNNSINAGSLIGRYNYVDELKIAHKMNNVYATGAVGSNGSNLFSLQNASTALPNITYKNTYYLPTAGSDSTAPIKGNTALTAKNNVLSNQVYEFTFKNAVPYVGADKLLNKLNTNIKASVDSELGSKVSNTWEDIKFAKLTIPTLKIGPTDFSLEAEKPAEPAE